MQQFGLPISSTLVKDSLPLLAASINSVLSNSSSTSFPSTNLQVGMLCVRTDMGAKGRIYELSGYTSDVPPAPVWTMVFDLNLTATSQEYVDQQITALTNSLNNGLSGVTYNSTLAGPALYRAADVASSSLGGYGTAGVTNVTYSGLPSTMVLSSVMPKGDVRQVQMEFKSDGSMQWRIASSTAWSAFRIPVTTINGISADAPTFYHPLSGANAAIRLREAGVMGSANPSTWAYAPKLEFYWSGYINALLGIDSIGQLVLQRIGYEATPATILSSNNLHTVQKVRYTTASYGFVASDLSGCYFRFASASALSAVVYANSSQAIPIGTVYTIRQTAAGQVTVVASAGVTILSPETLRLRKAGSTAMLIKIDTDVWELSGDLELL